MLADAGITPGVMKPLHVLVENGGDAATDRRQAARRSRRDRCERTVRLAPWADLARRGVPGDRRRGSGHPGDHRPQQRVRSREPNGTLHRELAAVDRDFVHAVYGNFPFVLAFVILLLTLDPAHARVPLDRAAAQGRGPEPALARRRLRRSSSSSSSRATAPRRSGTSRRPDSIIAVDPADDLRVPLRPLDGLRGVHAHAHARGVRRDGRHGPGDRARARAHRQARDERRARS